MFEATGKREEVGLLPKTSAALPSQIATSLCAYLFSAVVTENNLQIN